MKRDIEVLCQAFYEVSLEKKMLKENYHEFMMFFHWQKDKNVSDFFSTRSVEIVQEVLSKAFNPMLVRFIGVIIRNGSYYQMGRIVQQFREICIQKNWLIDLRVESSNPFNEFSKKQLINSITLADNQWLETEFTVDESLIYGIRVYLNQKIYDMNAATLFSQLEEKIS